MKVNRTLSGLSAVGVPIGALEMKGMIRAIYPFICGHRVSGQQRSLRTTGALAGALRATYQPNSRSARSQAMECSLTWGACLHRERPGDRKDVLLIKPKFRRSFPKVEMEGQITFCFLLAVRPVPTVARRTARKVSGRRTQIPPVYLRVTR